MSKYYQTNNNKKVFVIYIRDNGLIDQYFSNIPRASSS